MVGRCTGILHDGRLEEGNNGSLDVERSLGVSSFGAYARVDMPIVIIVLQSVFLHVLECDRLLNKLFYFRWRTIGRQQQRKRII